MPSHTAHYTLHSSRVLFLTREGRDGECVSPLFGASLVPHLRHLRHKHKSASLLRHLEEEEEEDRADAFPDRAGAFPDRGGCGRAGRTGSCRRMRGLQFKTIVL